MGDHAVSVDTDLDDYENIRQYLFKYYEVVERLENQENLKIQLCGK